MTSELSMYLNEQLGVILNVKQQKMKFRKILHCRDGNIWLMSICRTIFAKCKSKKFFYCYYKKLDSKLFKATLTKNSSETELSPKRFGTTFSLTLQNFAPLKQKYLRYNNSLLMSRTLKKAYVKERQNLDRIIINFEN